jgi:nucleoside-diphosphate-sugar epimerase
MEHPARPVVLVTGARGFIGAAAARALHVAGFDVRAGVRRPASGQTACDLDEAVQVRAAVAGARLVVHAAYGDVGAMTRQCATLLEAMGAAGVDKLIHLSSIAVYGGLTGDIAETAAPGDGLDAYGAAKIACEKSIRDWTGESAHPERRALMLRAGIVYGAGSAFWIDKLVERIRLGVWGTFGADGEGPAALAHVDDVARLIAMAARRMTDAPCATWPKAAALNVVGPETPSWNDYFRALVVRLGGGPLPELGGGQRAARQAAAFGAKVWRKFGLPGGAAMALAPTAGEIALFSRQARYRTQAARDLIGFSAEIGLDEGLARSLPQTKA